jgi:Rab3 GTPase-activating protein catalytic subunit
MHVKVRARLQSAQLLSDMESFKAANPGCCLADFVRWHSPRDWEEGAGLSSRMRLPSNMWTELWDQVRSLFTGS